MPRPGHLRSKLPDDWLFDFVDGEVDCNAAKEVKNLFPAPYYCYYRLPTFENVQEAHELLDELIEDQGFDALLGFSQGSALAASYLLHRQEADAGSVPPVKLAVFISASLPFSIDSLHGKAVQERDFPIARPESYLERPPLMQEDEVLARRWTPDRDSDRLRLPTVHVFGKQDDYHAQSKSLVDLCDGAGRTVIEHEYGHWIPQSENMSRKVASAIFGSLL